MIGYLFLCGVQQGVEWRVGPANIRIWNNGKENQYVWKHFNVFFVDNVLGNDGRINWGI
jgi:hypothetical protein